VEGIEYQIVVRGRLSETFALPFSGVSMQTRKGQTWFLTEPFDQSQLYGFLDRLQRFGLDLVSVQERGGPVNR
jgi:hypothetical protein